MKRIGVLFGGRSGEHDVSLQSATRIIKELHSLNYEVVMIGIDRDGGWHHFQGSTDLLNEDKWLKSAIGITPSDLKHLVDFVFPVIHGAPGEDGTLQGLLEMLDIPYAGSGVLGSAICMDKVMAKEVFISRGIPTSRYIMATAAQIEEDTDLVVKYIADTFPGHVFVKPANAGSSLGVTKAFSRNELKTALLLAASYDRRVIVEEALDAIEVETAVVGNEKPVVSIVGEITTTNKSSYYDYEAKYSDSSGTRIDIPAHLEMTEMNRIRELAAKAYRATDCAGFARVDFFVDRHTRKIYINEINTIPGFTRFSMFPMLWEESGTKFSTVIERIIELGSERHNDKNRRQTIRRR